MSTIQNTCADIALFEKLREPLPDQLPETNPLFEANPLLETKPLECAIETSEDLTTKPTMQVKLETKQSQQVQSEHARKASAHKNTPKKRGSFVKFILMSCALIVTFSMIVILSFIQRTNLTIDKPQYKDLDQKYELKAVNTLTGIERLLNEADIYERKGLLLKGLKNRLSAVNSYLVLSEFRVALQEADSIEPLIMDPKYKEQDKILFNDLEIIYHNLRSEIYYHFNDMPQAINHSINALELSLDYQQKDPMKIIKQYHLLAFNFDNIGDFEQSLKMRHNAINAMINLPESMRDEGEIISEMNNLGEEYRNLGALNDAHMILMRALKRVEKQYGINAPELIIVLNNLGLTEKARDNKTIAIALLQQALRLANDHYSDGHALIQNIAKNINRLR